MNSSTMSSIFQKQASVTDEDLQRIRRYSKYWRFYEGDQWEGERDVDRLITFNYCKAVVDKSVSFLFGKGFTFHPNHEDDGKIVDMLNEVWEYNQKTVTGIEMGQMGGVTGDCFVKVSWEEPETNGDGEPYDLEYPDGKVRLDVIPSKMVFPTYTSNDRKKMVKCEILYAVLTDGGQVEIHREEITRDKITIYRGDEVIEEKDNPINKINIVHIKNMPEAGRWSGQSDIEDIISLQKELNEKVTDISDIINYHSAPVTIIKGAKTKNLEKGARKVWGGLPTDSDVFNLQLNSDLSASNNYIDKVKTAIAELSNTPEESLGGMSNVSNATGVALRIQYAPLLEKTRIKRRTYGEGIREINKLILLFLQIKGTDEQQEFLDGILEDGDVEEIRKLFDIETKFPDPLPKDELLELEKISKRMDLGLETPKGALKALGYKGNIEEKLQEIYEYKAREQNMMFELGNNNADDSAGDDLGGIMEDLDAVEDNPQQN